MAFLEQFLVNIGNFINGKVLNALIEGNFKQKSFSNKN